MVDSTGLEPVSIIPVEQLPYTAHKLAGEPYDESMTTSKYAITGKGTGTIYLPNGKTVEFEYNGIRNYYHVDLYIKPAGRNTLKDLGEPYKYGEYTPTVPIILEIDYKGIVVRTWAALHLNYRKDNHTHFCAWLFNSDGDPGGSFGPLRISYGRDNDEVKRAPAAFSAQKITIASVAGAAIGAVMGALLGSGN